MTLPSIARHDISDPQAWRAERGPATTLPWRGNLPRATAAVLLQRSFTAGEQITVEVDWRGVLGEGARRALPVGETGVTRVN